MRRIIPFLFLIFLFPAKYSQAQDKVIDEIVAVVGNNIILKSDIEKQYLQYVLEGYTEAGEVRCKLLEEMLLQKLMLHQADLDSVVVSDSEVDAQLDSRMRYFISQIGSREKLEEYYKKSIDELKEELRDMVWEQMMISNIQNKIIENIKITPSEVRDFFNNIPEDSIPLINSQLVIGQIVKQPPMNIEEKERVKTQLNEFRERVLKGEGFSTLAKLYSEDPGSVKKGGELGFYSRGELYPEFEAVAFGLKPGEVSPVIETKAGFHIIQMIERRGEYVNVRHILIKPQASPLDLQKAKNMLDSVTGMVLSGKMTFEEAAMKFSDDPGGISGGLMINPATGTPRFGADEIDPTVFFIIDKMQAGDVSLPVPMRTEDGKQAYRILYLKERTEPHRANLKDDYDKIQEAALNEKQNKAIGEWIKKKTYNTYVRIAEEYKDCEYQYNWTQK